MQGAGHIVAAYCTAVDMAFLSVRLSLSVRSMPVLG